MKMSKIIGTLLALCLQTTLFTLDLPAAVLVAPSDSDYQKVVRQLEKAFKAQAAPTTFEVGAVCNQRWIDAALQIPARAHFANQLGIKVEFQGADKALHLESFARLAKLFGSHANVAGTSDSIAVCAMLIP